MSGVEVRVSGAVKTYRTPGGVDIEALAGVDLDVAASSVTAVVGPSGSGKSTLLHLIGGMDRPDAGTITSGDVELTTLSRSGLVRYRRSVGFVFQSFALLPALTARDNVMLPTIPYRDKTTTRGGHRGGDRGGDRIDTKTRAEELLDQVGLGGREHALPSQLSGGQRQRVAIARALMNDPQLLVADEPTGNLDSATGTAILDLLLQIRDTQGTTIMLATHDQHIADRCDTVQPMSDGRLLAA